MALGVSGIARQLLLAVTISAVLIACGSVKEESANPADANYEAASTEWQPIRSDNVAAARYDATTKTMYVRFLAGSMYAYSPVSEQLWSEFLAAQPNPWSAVGYPQLVLAGVPYRRLS